jgi:hypothetical protein
MSSSMPMWLVRAWCRLCLVRVRVRVRVRVVPIWRTRSAHSLTALVGATGLGGENKAGSAGQPEDTKARSRLELDLALAAGAGGRTGLRLRAAAFPHRVLLGGPPARRVAVEEATEAAHRRAEAATPMHEVVCDPAWRVRAVDRYTCACACACSCSCKGLRARTKARRHLSVGDQGAEECAATAVRQPAEVEPSASSTVASALRRRASTVPTT